MSSKPTPQLIFTLTFALLGCTTVSNPDTEATKLATWVSGVDLASNQSVQPFEGTNIASYKLSWSDEFNGKSIDETRWRYRLDCKHWSKQEKANNTLEDGLYRINLRQQSVACPNNHTLQPGQNQGDKPVGIVRYTGGGIISNDTFLYGFYEARLKVPTGRGWHSSFWMMLDGVSIKDNLHSHIELDPFENDSINLQHYQTDAHQWKPKLGTEDLGRSQNKVGTKQIHFNDLTKLNEFHVIGMEFTPSTVRYFFDGKLVSEVSFSSDKYKHNKVNIWLTSIGSYLGDTLTVDDAHLPEQMQVDYVRFFEKAR